MLPTALAPMIRLARGLARAAWIVGAVLVSGSAADAQVSVEELELHYRPGRDTATITRLIPVRNDLDRMQQVRVEEVDWRRGEDGRNEFVTAGSLAESCHGRLDVFPTSFAVAPGVTEYVRVTYRPGAAAQGCWSAVMVSAVQPPRPPGQSEGSSLTVELRTAVKIYVHQADAKAIGEVEDAWAEWVWRRADPTSRGRDTVEVQELVVRFRNAGTAHLKTQAVLEIRDVDARLVRRDNPVEYYTVPGAALNMRFPIRGLATGAYVAVVLLDFGGPEVLAAQIEFEVP